MKLREILLVFLDSKEIKIRIGNKQIKVNNEIVTDRELEIPIQSLDNSELGCFLYDNNIKLPVFGNIRDFFGNEPTNIKSLNFLTGYTLITISKKQEYVFMNL